ncbi:intraflagellar transport 20 [Dermatophagoides farinae]|uniref:Intraflagellar transport protein 20 n=2 Tax=Dermatophagoides farinae TaxID=6954 RepID=A0A922HR03_DERFA|nr:intraflagellar transport protein 20 homolog [Dermatophagoides farinae]KAH9502090.1 Intraflagellar transport protein 20 [Dermatophagoides farinae]
MMITSPFSTTIDNGNDFGLHVDDDDQTIRLIQPEIWQKSQQLQELINLFLEKNDDFKKIVSTFVQSLNDVGEMIEREKIKAIGSRSLIKALEMKRDSLREQYRNMIREKKIELERMQLEHELLRQEELKQQNLLGILRQLKR